MGDQKTVKCGDSHMLNDEVRSGGFSFGFWYPCHVNRVIPCFLSSASSSSSSLKLGSAKTTPVLGWSDSFLESVPTGRAMLCGPRLTHLCLPPVAFLAPGFPKTPQGHLIVPGLEPYSFLSQVALSLMELEPARV